MLAACGCWLPAWQRATPRDPPPMTALGFRHGDPRFPFLWESALQPPGRWHGPGEGPVHYLADTPDGAWAEFLRHEEITDAADLAGVVRRLWAVELPPDVTSAAHVRLDDSVARGDPGSYPICQAEARALRAQGATVLRAPSAALVPGGARGQGTAGGLREAADRDGLVWAVVGTRPSLRGWAAVDAGAPTSRVLGLVARFRRPADPAAEAAQDRRSGEDRRSGPDRRRASVIDLRSGAPVQRPRSGKERRAGRDRRHFPRG